MMDRILIVAFVAVIGGIFSACSDLPQVLVLHDPLTPEEHVTLEGWPMKLKVVWSWRRGDTMEP